MNQNALTKWEARFMLLAEHISFWSKDPSTQVGAVLVRKNRTIAAMGYNGFPRGIEDHRDLLHDRVAKYSRTVHAEMNAILSAGESVKGCALYLYPFMPCDRCAVHVIQSGIAKVVAPVPTADREDRWHGELSIARQLFAEAGVLLMEFEPVPKVLTPADVQLREF